MLYQTLLIGEHPYYVRAGTMHKFEEHRHSEIEIIFCLKGNFDILVSNTSYSIREGELVFISSMAAHEVPKNGADFHLLIEVGSMLLSEYFEALAGKAPENPIFSFTDNKELSALVKETAFLTKHPKTFSDLSIRGNLLKISALIMEMLVSENAEARTSKALRSVANIEKALHLIHTQYEEDLQVEAMAELCGYSKSNFCKIFKNITGNTFHNLLNQHRVKVAKNLLAETNLSIEHIAVQTGFADAKSFCRTFKNITGSTPSALRKKSDIPTA